MIGYYQLLGDLRSQGVIPVGENFNISTQANIDSLAKKILSEKLIFYVYSIDINHWNIYMDYILKPAAYQVVLNPRLRPDLRNSVGSKDLIVLARLNKSGAPGSKTLSLRSNHILHGYKSLAEAMKNWNESINDAIGNKQIQIGKIKGDIEGLRKLKNIV